MSRRPAGLLFALLAIGCAGGRPPALPEPADPSPIDLPEPADPLPTALPEPADPLPTDECRRIADLAVGGEHKPAADALAALRLEDRDCPADVAAAGSASSSRVAEADALLHEAQARQQAGDLDGAEDSLRAALEIYPRYEWAQKLLRDVERLREEQPGRSEEIASRLRLARAAAERKELDSAARLTLEALKARPAEPELRQELAAFAERLGLTLFSEGALESAKQLWQAALALVGDSPKLADYLEQVQRRIDSLEKIRDSG